MPNYTTNGEHLTDEIIDATKKYCGAAAVSWSENALSAIRRFVAKGVRTNIHFVVSKDSINECLALMKDPKLFESEGINAIVLLLHKAVGRASASDTPTFDDVRDTIDVGFGGSTPTGFDSCFMPLIKEAETKTGLKVPWVLLDSCEAGRFSVFIDEDLNVKPCSFCSGERFSSSLRKNSFDDIWKGRKFAEFRKILERDRFSCPALL